VIHKKERKQFQGDKPKGAQLQIPPRRKITVYFDVEEAQFKPVKKELGDALKQFAEKWLEEHSMEEVTVEYDL
jgi:hypothetical protein